MRAMPMSGVHATLRSGSNVRLESNEGSECIRNIRITPNIALDIKACVIMKLEVGRFPVELCAIFKNKRLLPMGGASTKM